MPEPVLASIGQEGVSSGIWGDEENDVKVEEERICKKEDIVKM